MACVVGSYSADQNLCLIKKNQRLEPMEAEFDPRSYALSNGPVRRSVVPATLAIRLPARVKRVALWA